VKLDKQGVRARKGASCNKTRWHQIGMIEVISARCRGWSRVRSMCPLCGEAGNERGMRPATGRADGGGDRGDVRRGLQRSYIADM
jgi:hypothetical protein